MLACRFLSEHKDGLRIVAGARMVKKLNKVQDLTKTVRYHRITTSHTYSVLVSKVSKLPYLLRS